MLEMLENRMLLSATLTRGLLVINGTPAADTIHVDLQAARLVVLVNGSEQSFRARSVKAISINGRDGDDFIVSAAGAIPARISGGAGDDLLSGGFGPDTLLGGDGSDQLFGQAGDDLLDGGMGNDRLNGGPGNDTADYSSRRVSVTVHLDGSPSGQEGEADSLEAIENIRGGSAADRLYGDSGDNVLWGGLGNDTLISNGGNDVLVQAAPQDRLRR